ncbi:MAG: 4Fe-4S dicluster domain-containing protein [Lachnospiraceae bacterium]|nr:4Fe-4S dicluster domain-containing protein [Lachnospiraceae bacterium]
MKVGIIADLASDDMRGYAEAWATQKVLKEFGITPIAIAHEIENINESEMEKEEEKKGFGAKLKGLFGVKEEKTPAVKKRQISEFAKDRFVIGNGTKEVGHEKGIWQNMDHYLVTNPIMKQELEKEEHFYNPLYEVKHAAILVNQKIYHELAKNPELTKEYMLVDVKNADQKTKHFIEHMAKERGLAIVENADNPSILKPVARYRAKDIESYIGYMRHAACVVTDTYITTVMAFLHEKDFVSILENEEAGEIKEVLSLVKLADHAHDLAKDDKKETSYPIKNKAEFRAAVKAARQEIKKNLGMELKLEQYNLYVDCPTNILRSECCGCSACKEVCPTNAIAMVPDKEGFLYPVVDKDKCIDCKLCAKQCVKKENPQTISYEKSYPKVLCAINENETERMGSSSGGVFPVLADYAINVMHGYVVGVRYDENMNAVSDIADNMEDVKAFYGAKYVKSDFSHVFPKIKELLNEGKFVLYSGLPCEAAGLKAYLRKPYDNLMVTEILCHASPSPKVFKKYVEYLNKKFKSEVVDFNFRDKSEGWIAEHNSLKITFKNKKVIKVNARKNNYYRCFAKDYIARPGCGQCSFVYKNRVGDITMGDFWGIRHTDPSMYDDKGTSIIMINTKKGDEVFGAVADRFHYKESDLQTAFKYNHKKPIVIKDARDEFFEKLDKAPINDLLESYNDLAKK